MQRTQSYNTAGSSHAAKIDSSEKTSLSRARRNLRGFPKRDAAMAVHTLFDLRNSCAGLRNYCAQGV